MSSWVKKIEYDHVTTEYFIEIDDIAREMGWLAGDTLTWILNEDGTVTLKKEEEKEV